MVISSDIVIVGGGVIGLTCAYVLAKAGMRVTVLERKNFGQEASWAGAGIIPPGNPERAATPFDRLRSLSSASFADFSKELRAQTGIDNGYLRCGGLEFTAAEAACLPEEWRGAGVAIQPLTEAEVREREPALAPGLGPAYLLPGLAQLRNPRHIKALVAACTALKVDLYSHCPVRGWSIQDSRILGLRTDQNIFQAGIYLVAGGAWTDELLGELGWHLDIQPVRGQIALLAPPAPVIHHVLIWGDRYLVPRQDGKILVGSTEEHAGYDARTTVCGQQGLLALACKLVPELAQAEVERTWAGLRPGSSDGIPFIGAVPGHDNVLVAAGHFRAGIQLSPGTAQLVKEMILRQPLTIPAAPFRLDRRSGAR